MQKNVEKSKHILFKYQTIEELIQGTGYMPSFKALALISPNMTVDMLIEKLLEINELTLACEVMIYALHPRARIWWGCSIIKSLHEELFPKLKDQKAAEAEAEAEEKEPKEKPEAIALPKSEEEAKEMLNQKAGEQKEALGLSDDKKDGNDSEKASDNKSEKEELSYEQTKEEIEKLNAQQEKQRAEFEKAFEEESKIAEQKNQEALKKFEEAVASMSPEDKAFYDQCQTKIDQYFKENIGMTKQEVIDFAYKVIEKASKADESGDPAQQEAVLNEVISALANSNKDNISKMFDEVIKVQQDFEQQEKNNSSEKEAATAESEEKSEKESATLEPEEDQKAEKIKEVEAKAAEIENSLRKRAYEAAVAWVNEPTKPNTLTVEKYSQEAGAYPEGMLCLASYWSYGDFTVSSSAQKKEKGKVKTPETIIRVDPSLPPKGIYSTFLMAGLHEGGIRKPADRFALYYQMGEKIACGKDNWTSEKKELKLDEPAIVSEKPELKPEEKLELKPELKTEANLKEKPEVELKEKPAYTRWKMD